MRNLFLLLISLFSFLSATAQESEYPDVHDPVMARGEDGRYYIFSTGMGIGVMSSADMKVWRREPSVFNVTYVRENLEPGMQRPRSRSIDWSNSTLPHWTVDSVRGFNGHMWAPDISFHNGRWYVYYSCSTFGKNRSAIGVATNKTLDPSSPDFKWEDLGPVVVSHQHQDNWNAIDPNLIWSGKKPYLTFGSFWDGIQLIRLDRKDLSRTAGKMKTISRRVGRKLTLAEIDNVENFTIEGGDTIEAGENAVEAPFIIHHGDYYYLLVSFDYCCRGEKSTYKTVYGRSRKVEGPYLDRQGNRMERGGGTILYGPDKDFFGIGHCSAYEFDGQWYFVSHAYDKAQNGRAKLFIRPINFTSDGWIE